MRDLENYINTIIYTIRNEKDKHNINWTYTEEKRNFDKWQLFVLNQLLEYIND